MAKNLAFAFSFVILTFSSLSALADQPYKSSEWYEGKITAIKSIRSDMMSAIDNCDAGKGRMHSWCTTSRLNGMKDLISRTPSVFTADDLAPLIKQLQYTYYCKATDDEPYDTACVSKKLGKADAELNKIQLEAARKLQASRNAQAEREEISQDPLKQQQQDLLKQLAQIDAMLKPDKSKSQSRKVASDSSKKLRENVELPTQRGTTGTVRSAK